MKIQTSLLVGLTLTYLWPAAHAAENTKLAQIKTLISEYRQKNFGPFAGFAGVYDISRTCQPFVSKSVPIAALNKVDDTVAGTYWLLSKSLIWFEGDAIVTVIFLYPDKVDRGTLKFKKDYAISSGLTLKLYDVNYAGGGSDVMAFLPDRDLFDGKFDGKNYDFSYAMRCTNENQIIGSIEEIWRRIDQ